MKIAMKVPRRLVWHVTTTIAADDQPTYWRLYWHIVCYVFNRRAERVVVAITTPCLFGFALWVQDWASMLVGCAVWVVSLYLVRKEWKRHLVTIERIYAEDDKKWDAIRAEVAPVCAACQPDDPTEEVIVTLPNDA